MCIEKDESPIGGQKQGIRENDHVPDICGRGGKFRERIGLEEVVLGRQVGQSLVLNCCPEISLTVKKHPLHDRPWEALHVGELSYDGIALCVVKDHPAVGGQKELPIPFRIIEDVVSVQKGAPPQVQAQKQVEREEEDGHSTLPRYLSAPSGVCPRNRCRPFSTP